MKDTIVAISTATGLGAISIVRLSGDESFKIIKEIYKGKDLEKQNSHTINYGHIYDNEKIIDEVLVSIMKAPRTYTGEDIVEINCHGGIAATNRILDLCLDKGARLAEKGEFTRRAYLNGRIDLVQAEAVADLTSANSDKLREISAENLNGRLSNLIKKYRDKITELITNIEVNIDYPEYEDIEVVTKNQLEVEIKNIKNDLMHLLKTSENNTYIKNGINALIIGRPNVGKSSILNKLIDEDKAIVTNLPGTTRDIVEGTINIEGININLIDTAGIRDTDDIIEEIGVEKSLSYIEKADLVILVFNSNEIMNDDDKKLLEATNKKTRIIVLNKNDLEPKIDIDEHNYQNIIKINTIDLNSIDKLKDKIIELFNLEKIASSNETQMVNTRQRAKLRETIELAINIEKSLAADVYIDMIEIDLKRIWDTLGDIIGVSYKDEIIDEIFARFCLGK